MNDNSKIALSILGGAVAGAVAGLLLAPNKGTETRQQISEGAGRLRGNLREQADRGLDTINNLLGRADSKLGELERDAKDAISNVMGGKHESADRNDHNDHNNDRNNVKNAVSNAAGNAASKAGEAAHKVGNAADNVANKLNTPGARI